MLPVAVNEGSITRVWVPVAVNVFGSMLKLVPDQPCDVSVEPLGLRMLTVTDPIEFPVACPVTCWPLVPLNVSRQFWPGVVIVKVTPDPLMAIVPKPSAG